MKNNIISGLGGSVSGKVWGGLWSRPLKQYGSHKRKEKGIKPTKKKWLGNLGELVLGTKSQVRHRGGDNLESKISKRAVPWDESWSRIGQNEVSLKNFWNARGARGKGGGGKRLEVGKGRKPVKSGKPEW